MMAKMGLSSKAYFTTLQSCLDMAALIFKLIIMEEDVE